MDKKNIKVNKLIQSLISSFKDYDNNLKNRFKADSIILGIEENVDKNLNKLINLSGSRYKYAKFGVKLDNILNRQKINYENLSKQIKNDKIYSSNILDKEKKKLFKSVVTLKNQEISDIRGKLINSLRNDENKNKIKRKDETKSRRHIKSEPKIPKIKIANDNHNSDFSERKSIINLSLRKSRRPTFKNAKNESTKFIEDIMKEDYKNLFSTIDSYHTFLEKLKNISNKQKNGKRIKINKDNFEHIQSNLSPNSIKCLTYRENKTQSKVKNELNKDLEFDLKEIQNIKIIHDKNNQLKNNIIYKSKEYNNIDDNNKCLLHTSSSSKINESFAKNELSHFDYFPFKKKKSNKILGGKKSYNFKNTANIVFNETQNGLHYSQNFINKRKIFNNYFDKYFRDSLNKLKKSCKKIKIETYQTNESENENLEGITTYKNEIYDYGQKKRENIRKEFRDIYEKKKIEWKNLENLKKLEKMREKEKRKDIELFLLNSQDKNLFKKNKKKI